MLQKYSSDRMCFFGVCPLGDCLTSMDGCGVTLGVGFLDTADLEATLAEMVGRCNGPKALDAYVAKSLME